MPRYAVAVATPVIGVNKINIVEAESPEHALIKGICNYFISFGFDEVSYEEELQIVKNTIKDFTVQDIIEYYRIGTVLVSEPVQL